MTDRVWRLFPVVSFHLKIGLVVPVAGRHELGILREVSALRGHMVDAIVDSSVCGAVHGGGVWLVPLARKRRNDLMHDFFSRFL